ncbi:UNVERIFIED_CONTAM: Stamen-specific protein FIL1 [Sesamum radiatum]|uniref:Stamen-specific protein FIL1 n=1 Tax=Sesamum radiatum TaxID=300843 RepID=A0AAW2KBK7_SESRA
MMKSVFGVVVILTVTVTVVVAQTQFMAQYSESDAQTCSSSLASLNVCAPFAVPGAAPPSADCCAALQGVDHGCFCDTLRITSRIPAQCNLPPLNCAGSYNLL